MKSASFAPQQLVTPDFAGALAAQLVQPARWVARAGRRWLLPHGRQPQPDRPSSLQHLLLGEKTSGPVIPASRPAGRSRKKRAAFPSFGFQEWAALLLRLAVATNFLSAVASRLGLWGRASSGWPSFLAYTRQVNSFAPSGLVPPLAVAATVAELTFGLLLLVGYRIRWASGGAAGLTLLFALAMTYSFGLKEAFDYSVFVDCAAALLLAALPPDHGSLDHHRAPHPSAFSPISPLP